MSQKQFVIPEDLSALKQLYRRLRNYIRLAFIIVI